jgi:alkylation response protein AidB-like acyl-CoA dehydrogenase
VLTSVFTADHEDLRRGLRAFLQTASSEQVVRQLMETEDGFDAETWRRLTQEFAVTALLVPEDLGGAGYGFAEMGVVVEEAGRALLVAPLLSTVLATYVLLGPVDDAVRKRWLPELAAGSTRGTVALAPVGTAATSVSVDGGRLTGSVSYVLDGATADVIIVATEDGLHLVEAGTQGLTRTPLQTADLTRKLARLDLDDVAATPLPGVTEQDVRDVAAVLLALEQVGAAQQVLETTVASVKTRNQFGRAIGSFQAVKHRCADMLVEVESARSAAYAALGALVTGDPGLPVLASVAKAFCSDALVLCAGESIQLHGGIGFTWEHPAHLYFKRAKASQLLLGDPGHHRARLAELLGLHPGTTDGTTPNEGELS